MKNKKIFRLDTRLDYSCNQKLKTLCKKSKLPKTAVIEKLIMNEQIHEKPDDEFYEVIGKLIDLAENIRIIAEKAEYLNDIDADMYKSDMKKINEFITILRLKY